MLRLKQSLRSVDRSQYSLIAERLTPLPRGPERLWRIAAERFTHGDVNLLRHRSALRHGNGGWGVVLRELMPQDLKLEIETLSCEEAMLAAHYLGAVVGKAQGRQMDQIAKTAWRDELRRRWPKGLDAPFWLWSSVIDPVGSHESAYLEHCRRYALDAQAAWRRDRRW